MSGTTVKFTGQTAGGLKATCSGTLERNTLSGTCLVEGVAPCRFKGKRR